MESSWRFLLNLNAREYLAIYLLASISNLFINIPEYLAVYPAAVNLLPVDLTTRGFIATYGYSWGVALNLFWTNILFQGILALIVLALAVSSTMRGAKWVYILLGIFSASYVGYWLGAKFLRTLDWISLLQENHLESSTAYSALFWFGLVSTLSYFGMILLLRRSYNRLETSRVPNFNP